MAEAKLLEIFDETVKVTKVQTLCEVKLFSDFLKS